MGKALEIAVARIAVVREDVAAALTFVRENPGAADARTPPTPVIEFSAPVQGGTEGPLVPPGVAVALNNLRAGFDALRRAPGGDLGGLRDKINKDLATAVDAIIASLKGYDGYRGQRGRRGTAPANEGV
jgi:hypothetical protein